METGRACWGRSGVWPPCQGCAACRVLVEVLRCCDLGQFLAAGPQPGSCGSKSLRASHSPGPEAHRAVCSVLGELQSPGTVSDSAPPLLCQTVLLSCGPCYEVRTGLQRRVFPLSWPVQHDERPSFSLVMCFPLKSVQGGALWTLVLV